MVEYFDKSRCRLKEFPGYTCYLLDHYSEDSEERTVKCIQNGLANINWAFPYSDFTSEPEYMLIPCDRPANCTSRYTYGEMQPKGVVPPLGAKLYVSPKCRIPVSLLSRYDVVTSVNDTLPEYVVLQGTVKPEMLISNVRLFVNDESKVVIALHLDDMFDSIPEDSASYMPSLIESCEFSIPEISRFRPVEHEQMLDVCTRKGDMEYLWLNGLLPANRIVNEYDLYIGEENLPYDIFKSCMLMLSSTDIEMQKAACFTLARYDCRDYMEILKWAFYRTDSVFEAKRLNKPFNWLHRLTQRDGSRYPRTITNRKTTIIARKFIAELTDNKVTYDVSGNASWPDGTHWPEGSDWRDLARRTGRLD